MAKASTSMLEHRSSYSSFKVGKHNNVNVHNGQRQPNLRRKKEGVNGIGTPAGNSGS